MLFNILVSFLLLSHTLYSADKPAQQQMIKLEFEDKTQGEYPLEQVNLFTTLKNMLEDLGISDQPIPLSNIPNQKIFNLLRNLRLTTTNIQLTELLKQIRGTVVTIFSDLSSEESQQLINSADYLDAGEEFIQVLVNKYADFLTTNNLPINIEIHPKYQRSIINYILENLLKDDTVKGPTLKKKS